MEAYKSFTEYEHSRASDYKTGEIKNYDAFDYRLLQSFTHRGWLYQTPVRLCLIVEEEEYPERTKKFFVAARRWNCSRMVTIFFFEKGRDQGSNYE